MAAAPQFDQELCRFLEAPATGKLIMLSDDPVFLRAIKTTLYKTLAIKTDCLDLFHEPSAALKSLRGHVSRKIPVLIVADRMLRGQNTYEFMRNVKNVFSEARLLVVTSETTREELSLLYEIGVDSVLTKPASTDTLVEKLAGAIKPQGKISQLVQEARRHLDLGETEAVLRISESILNIKDKSPVALMLMGDALLLEGRRDEAIAAYESAHAGARLYLEPLKKMAEAHRETDLGAYLACLRKLDSISPLNVDRKCEIGKVYMRMNDLERADTYFSAAIATARREAIALVERVVTEIAESVAESVPALAEKYYVQLLELKGDDLTEADMVIFNRLGIALRRQGKWREAVDNYKKALTVSPKDERVLYNMGLAYVDGALHRMAVGVYDQVLRNNPDFPKTAAVVAFNMASAYGQARDTPMARKLLATALEQNPEHGPSLKLLARMDEMNVD